jgi:hypothetical protein
LTSVTLPQSLRIIKRNAFDGNSSLVSITIPSGVTTIENLIFGDCHALVSITVEAEVPPTLNWGLYSNGDTMMQGGLTIYVPAGSVNAYKAADGWKEYAAKITAIIP